MFVANAITVWVEALKAVFADDATFVDEHVRGIPVLTNFPQLEIEYPSLWVNFAVQGDVSNVGIGHYELADDGEGGQKQLFRWSFSGHVEIVASAMGNLERALLIDEVCKAIAVARVDENDWGLLRDKVQDNGIIGMIAGWESFVVGGFGEQVGTPWATDDVIYEGSISIPCEGEVLLDPVTGTLVPLSAINIEALGPDDGAPPTPGPGVGPGIWV
jgi:hypothetical protein